MNETTKLPPPARTSTTPTEELPQKLSTTTHSIRDILHYLYQTYGLVTTAQIMANNERFRAAYNGSTDLEAYFNDIDD